MALTDVRKVLPPKGGVSSIELFAVADVLSLEHDRVRDEFFGLILDGGATPVVYEFREGEARYTENLRYEYGETIVEHRLEIGLSADSDTLRRAIGQLAAGSSQGIAAIVHTNGMGSLLAGYSARFGGSMAMRLMSAQMDTGGATTDRVNSSIVLGSEDVSPACIINV